MSSLQNLAALTVFKRASRQQIKTIVKVPELVGALGPNRTAQLQTLRRLLKFLDLYVEYTKASNEYTNATRLHKGESRLDKARHNRIQYAKNKVNTISKKATQLRNKIGLRLYRNTVPFNNSTLRNAVRRISLLRNEGNNREKLFRNLQALYARNGSNIK
jgi:predicted DsbA family dithiol-disulfide isomerase